MNYGKNIAIIGGGNIGTAILKGFLASGELTPSQLSITRHKTSLLSNFAEAGVNVSDDNLAAASRADILIIAVLPRQLEEVVRQVAPVLDDSKILVSVVTAFTIEEIGRFIDNKSVVVRAMPNTAIAIGESMTCLSADESNQEALNTVKAYFELCGEVLQISEMLQPAATILAACGVAFFMRYIRAASQGGIQVGFHANEAQIIAAQTAKGASELLLASGNHPETEIDKVTTPMGCTIAGLNEMEHNGMSSALIKGIVKSYNEITKLK